MESEPRRRVLVVEDDETLRESLRYTLSHEGFDVSVAADGPSGLAAALAESPDIVLLDLMLPGMDGMEVCRRIRRRSRAPIVMLTARREEVDKVEGLDTGADDYVTKPFSMRELMARLRAIVRRTDVGEGQPAQAPPVVSSGDLTIDLRRREVRRDGAPLRLRPKEFDLLAFLARHPGQVFGREPLLDRVWGYDFLGGSRTVDVHVRWLREKIERDPAHPERLQTVRGAGYRFDG